MRELVVMEATSQLGLFQVRGNVFVWHLLKASLEKIDFLEYLVNICSNIWCLGRTSSSFQALPPPVEDFLFL